MDGRAAVQTWWNPYHLCPILTNFVRICLWFDHTLWLVYIFAKHVYHFSAVNVTSSSKILRRINFMPLKRRGDLDKVIIWESILKKADRQGWSCFHLHKIYISPSTQQVVFPMPNCQPVKLGNKLFRKSPLLSPHYRSFANAQQKLYFSSTYYSTFQYIFILLWLHYIHTPGKVIFVIRQQKGVI